MDFQEKILLARNYPIAELVRGRLELKQAGKNSKCLCPFHLEKHPSCVIFVDTNSFVCFSCGEKGDVIKLAMHIYGLSFKQIIDMLQK